MEKRVIQLESLAALQDETIARFHEELFRQQQDLARLRRQLDALMRKVEALETPGPIAGNERPPHY